MAARRGGKVSEGASPQLEVTQHYSDCGGHEAWALIAAAIFVAFCLLVTIFILKTSPCISVFFRVVVLIIIITFCFLDCA